MMGTTPAGYAAKMGDVVVSDMRGFEKKPDGTKGDRLPAIASGDQVEVATFLRSSPSRLA